MTGSDGTFGDDCPVILWKCDDCGHEEPSLTDDWAGKPTKKLVGKGIDSHIVLTLSCPECESENWGEYE